MDQVTPGGPSYHVPVLTDAVVELMRPVGAGWVVMGQKKNLYLVGAAGEFRFEMLSLCSLRAGAREPPEKLERASTHNDDLTKRPRATDRVKRPEHRGVQRSSRPVAIRKFGI